MGGPWIEGLLALLSVMHAFSLPTACISTSGLIAAWMVDTSWLSIQEAAAYARGCKTVEELHHAPCKTNKDVQWWMLSACQLALLD